MLNFIRKKNPSLGLIIFIEQPWYSVTGNAVKDRIWVRIYRNDLPNLSSFQKLNFSYWHGESIETMRSNLWCQTSNNFRYSLRCRHPHLKMFSCIFVVSIFWMIARQNGRTCHRMWKNMILQFFHVMFIHNIWFII